MKLGAVPATTLLCAAALVMASCKPRHEADAASAAEPRGPATVAAVRQDLISQVTAAGILHYRTVHYVHSALDGKVKIVPVRVGDDVRKGTGLLEFDPSSMREDEEQINAQQDALRAELELLAGERAYQMQTSGREAAELDEALRVAKEDEAQAGQAFERGMISAAERRKTTAKVRQLVRQRETADTAAAQAQQRLKLEASKLDLRRRELRTRREAWVGRLKNLRVVSPADGRVIAVADKLASSRDATSPVILKTGELIGAIAERDRYVIKMSLSEKDVLQIKPGRRVHFVQKSSGTHGHGVVRTVSAAAEAAAAPAGTFTAEVDVEKVDGEIVVGGRVECRILVAERSAAIVIPLEAVWFAQGQAYAQVLDRDRIVRRQLRLGVDDGRLVEVIQGIVVGEQVVRFPVVPKTGREPE